MARVSIEDVANLAGVSITTVSRVINNKDYPVAEKTKKKVLKAVKELNYFPDFTAQNLRNNFSNTIGLITREISDPYFGIIARAVTERASYYGVLSIVCNTGRNPVNELQYHDLLWQHKVRGIILSGGGLDADDYRDKLQEQIKRYNDHGNRIVSLAPQGLEMPYVTIDNRATGEMITDYLVDLGHRKIAFLGGPEQIYTASERVKGYKLSLTKHGLTFDPSLLHHGQFSWESGYEAARRLLLENREFSGICCANDDIAYGVLQALKEQNIQVPGQVSVISIGDLPLSTHIDPPLTTAQVPLYDMALRAVDVIMDGSKPDHNASLIFKTPIVKRLSTAPYISGLGQG
ncbi:LacI family DNA-binding transcriptional regulator [Anaerospora sp.]|jgi:LacI family transcriptional regulator|uniref:LacI family DNA-binding transcriptional regulator n=1 Tax=Anaerospora sp. TaxID=1960278 RepID=UPI00289FC576|nr:LacI family DNA-binding transcriptional regulator [Anaerospora sp.]